MLAIGVLVATVPAHAGHATPAATGQNGPSGHHPTAPRDTAAPGPVTGLTVSGNAPHSISLAWRVPRNADLAQVLIRRAVGDQPPLSASDGTLVAVLGSHAARFTDRKLDSGTRYSYAVYTTDRQHNLSAASTLTALTRTTNDRTGLKGVLTDKQGNPIAGALAHVRVTGSGDYAGAVVTNSEGSYRVTNLAPGTYTVCYEPTPQTRGQSPTGYLPGCYRQQPFGYGDRGTPVTVTAGKVTGSLRDYLLAAGAISGRITDSAGTGIGDVNVYVVFPYPEYFFYSTTTAADGTYTLTGLPADSYQICFDAGYATGASSTGYLSECYDDQPAYNYGGTPIPVTLGTTATGIDASLDQGGAVAGKVTDPAGNPVPDVTASLISPSSWGLGTTDGQGNYTINGVSPGLYSACFDGNYAVTPDAPFGYTRDCSYSGADFEVTAGRTVTRNATVEVAGAIGGSVSAPDGSPVAGVMVNVYDSAGEQLNGTNTDDAGNWQLPGFGAGQYTVCYDPTFTSGGYRRSCYDGQPDGTTTGTPVTVTARELTTVNGTLLQGATITGTVTDSAGTPLSGVSVFAMLLGGDYPSYYASTDENGSYTLSGAGPGSYTVCFYATDAQGPAPTGYVSECYDDQPIYETADPVTITGTETLTVNAELAVGAAITGQVTDTDGTGVQGVDVVVTSLASGLDLYVPTDVDGSYTVPGLRSGDYTVCFYPGPGVIGPSTGYLEQCWDGQEAPAGTQLSVEAGTVTGGIDARLGIGAAITGTVTNAGGAPVPDVSVYVQGTDGTYYRSTGVTGPTGHYVVTGLPAKPLVVCFAPPYDESGAGYQWQCYRDAPDSSTATPVTPTAGETTGGIDAVLQEAPPQP